MSLLHKPDACLRIRIRREWRRDVAAREQLLDAAFGADRLAKTSERLRESRVPARGLAFVASDGGCVVGTIRLWSITAGPDRRCLLLGPLAVAADAQNRGIGGALMQHALRKAALLRHDAVLLVGDVGYYGRFGFSSEHTGALRMPGPFERERLLGYELVPGALKGARGLIAVNRPPGSRLARIMDSVGCCEPELTRLIRRCENPPKASMPMSVITAGCEIFVK